MDYRNRVFGAGSSLLLIAAAACSSVGAGVGTGEQDSTAEDLAQAKQILALLGGPQGKCVQCHTATPADIKRWGTSMQAVDAACFAPASLSAAQRVACLHDGAGFSATKLGLYAAGVASADVANVFHAAFPNDPSQYASFTRQAGMPKFGVTPLTAAEFALVKAWVLRGMPQLDQASSPDAGADGGVTCRDTLTPELTAHVASMKTTGWGARLSDVRTPMFGCGAAASAVDCLKALPEITATVGASGVTQHVRELRRPGVRSHYWVRSSADGRYVGLGLNPTSKIVDLTTAPETAPIDVAAPYDPFFFPSNDGFAFAGVGAGQGLVACKQSILAGATHLSLTEAGCSTIGSSVYESIGSSLDGARYFVTVGSHENDDGGNSVTHPLPAAFGAQSKTRFIPMVNDGLVFRPQTPVDVALPGEGDLMLSPSSLLAATRFGLADRTKQGGYRVHLVKATANGPTTNVDVPLGAEICMKGGKATFSFDERFLAAHQYVDTSEPDQASLPSGSSNIVMADLTTGAKTRLTEMKAGQYALYPHFRADGWLYFLVRDMNAGIEYVAATDAAIQIAAAHP